jgi:tetratricopeptide (TPR) repeat protein
MPEMNRDEIAKLEALYASNPGGRVFTHLAEAYRKGGEYSRARAILEQGLTKHPGYASAYVVLGRVFLDLDDAAQATASFRRVLDLDPHNLVALRSLGDIARGAGRPTEALQYFEELSHQEPNNAEIETIINELRQAPAEPVREVVETTVEAAPVEEPPRFEEAPVEAAAEAPAEAPVMEEVSEPAATASFSSGFEEYVAPDEPAQQEFAEPEPQRAPEPEPEPELEPEMFSAYANAQPPVDFLPEIEVGEPDLTDLVAPDIDLDWGAGEPTQEALPGDLAEFAALSAHIEVEQPVEPVAEEVPTFELPAFYEEEPPISEPVAEDERVAEDEPAEEITPAESLTPATPVLTETMANLYREQGLYDQAADVYRSLLRDRPYDSDLQTKLDEVESLAAPEAPPAFEGLPDQAVDEPVPFLGTAPEAPEDLGAQDEEVESPWMSSASRSSSPPTPYAWAAENQTSEGEDGPAISEYFQSLLSWRPATKGNGASAVTPEPEPEVSSFEPTAPAPETPFLDLTPSEMVMPPATPADSAMPWEEPVSPSTPVAPIAPPPAPPQRPAARASENPVEAAFEEWFSGDPETEPVAPPPGATPAATQPTTPTPPLMPLSSEGDGDDDDLEMFRSWLQSLKK